MCVSCLLTSAQISVHSSANALLSPLRFSTSPSISLPLIHISALCFRRLTLVLIVYTETHRKTLMCSLAPLHTTLLKQTNTQILAKSFLLVHSSFTGLCESKPLLRINLIFHIRLGMAISNLNV